MNQLRFSIKQFLLLFILIGLFAGLFSAITSQPVRNDFRCIAISPSGERLAYLGGQGVDVMDLSSGRIVAEHRWPGSMLSFPMVSSGRGIRFVDENTVVFERTQMFGTMGTEYLFLDLEKGTTIGESFNFASPTIAPTGLFDGHFVGVDQADVLTPAATGTANRVEITVVDLRTQSERTVALPQSNPAAAPGTISFSKIEVSSDGRYMACSDSTWQVSPEINPFLFDLVDERKLGELPGTGFQELIFSPDSSHLLGIQSDQLTMFQIIRHDSLGRMEEQQDQVERQTESTGDRISFKELWVADQPNGQDWDRPVFSADGKLIAISSVWQRGDVMVLNAADGTPAYSLIRGFQEANFEFSPDSRMLVVTPKQSDKKIEIRDAVTGELIRRIGGNFRMTKAIIWSVLFLVWALVWGLFGRDQKRLPEKIQASAAVSTKQDPLGDISASDVTIPEAMLVDKSAAVPSPIAAVWILMAIGGTFAIAWSVIPMFYFQTGFFENFIPAVVVIRSVMASICLGVGLLAATRGFGRYEELLHATAILQIVNVISFDVVNFGLGIAELALLSQASVRGYLQRK